MEILVVGGSRFIGRSIVERLLRQGHDVTLLNRGLSHDPFGTRVRRVLGDRRNHETIARAAARRDFEVVVDITAYNETETSTMVETFRGRVAHFIHISTAAVYLIRQSLLPPYREDDFIGPLVPRTGSLPSSWSYAVHKRRCEEVLQRAWSEHRFPFTSFRLPMMVGPHDYTRRADAYLERLAAGGPLIVPEGGLNAWGFLWVEDLAEVIASNLASRVAMGRAYNLAQREATSLRQFLDAAAAALGRSPRLVSLPSAWLDAIGLGCSFSPYTHDHDVLLDCRSAAQDLLFRPTPAPTWVEALVENFRGRWNGQVRSFAVSRQFEIELAREVTKIRLPPYGLSEASGR